MSPPRAIYVGDVVAVAERILQARSPEDEACRLSVDERVALAAVVAEQHRMIQAAGLSYGRPDAARLEAAE